MAEVKLIEMPENFLLSLKDVTYSPESPRKKAPFTVNGKVELFGIPFLAPIWVIARVTYPEKWWEEIIPVIGSPTVGEGTMAIGGDFEITFPKGFDREGEFTLKVEAHAGPTYTVDSITLPPFPPIASEETTFIVGGEIPPEEVGFRNFRILSYSKNGGPPVTPPGVLELDVGDRCRVNLGLDHMNGAVTGKFHAAIWQKTLIDPHDEVGPPGEKTFSVPPTPDWEPYEDSVDIIITSAISPGSEYGLYTKIMGITGGDIFTEYLENVITIIGAPPEEADIKDFDFKLTGETYDIGVQVPFTAPYDYKGIEQEGQLIISIGTGIAPTFNPVHTYDPLPVNFGAAADWEPRGLGGNITLPELEAGQTYSVRAKLETLVKRTQETDTDWSAFTIAGPPTTDIRNFDFRPQAGTYGLGASVPFDAPYEYKGKAQGGWLTISLGTGVAPSFFTKHTFPRQPVTFDEAMDWTPGHLTGSFTLPTTLQAGQTYSVRAKLETDDDKQETDTDWGVIVIEAGPPTSDIRNFDFRAQSGTYGMGGRVPFDAPYEYKGNAQGGWLTISLGTGAAPSFFTKHTFPRQPVTFNEAMDWTSSHLTGSFTLPTTLQTGQTYNVRAKLETDDDKQETDTDWGVITIEAVAPPEEYTLTGESSPSVGWISGLGSYDSGRTVTITARLDSWAVGSYEFDHWGGAASGTSPTTTVYMNGDKHVIAYFRAVAPPAVEYTLTGESSPSVGWISGLGSYDSGKTVTITARLDSWAVGSYEFDHWGGDASGTSPTTTVYMNGDKHVIAYFRAVAGIYTLTVRQSPAVGWITKSPDKPKYAHGDIVQITSYKDSWAIATYALDYWDCDGEWVGTAASFSFMVLASRTLTAHYRRI